MKQPIPTPQKSQQSFGPYIIGFILSLLLTLAAYFLVQQHIGGQQAVFSRQVVIGAVGLLAVLQLIVQAVFFLHLGRESKPRWNLMIFLFTGLVILIVVFGSLWIIQNLRYQRDSQDQPSPSSVNTYIIKDEGFNNKH